MEAGGRELPAGATVIAPTSLVHRDPRGFRDPDRFEPERWLADITPSWPLFPFGGGARRCVGEPLAQAAIEAVVPAVLRTLKLTPLSAEPERMVQRATVLAPQRSLLVRASRGSVRPPYPAEPSAARASSALSKTSPLAVRPVIESTRRTCSVGP